MENRIKIFQIFPLKDEKVESNNLDSIVYSQQFPKFNLKQLEDKSFLFNFILANSIGSNIMETELAQPAFLTERTH